MHHGRSGIGALICHDMSALASLQHLRLVNVAPQISVTSCCGLSAITALKVTKSLAAALQRTAITRVPPCHRHQVLSRSGGGNRGHCRPSPFCAVLLQSLDILCCRSRPDRPQPHVVLAEAVTQLTVSHDTAGILDIRRVGVYTLMQSESSRLSSRRC